MQTQLMHMYIITGVVAEDAAKLWLSDERNVSLMPAKCKSIVT